MAVHVEAAGKAADACTLPSGNMNPPVVDSMIPAAEKIDDSIAWIVNAVKTKVEIAVINIFFMVDYL